MPGVPLMPRATAFGYYQHNMFGARERVADHLADPDPAPPRERMWQVRPKQVVLAAGALERPLVFADNDRPGIMLADAAPHYVNRDGVHAGRRARSSPTMTAAYARRSICGRRRRYGGGRRPAGRPPQRPARAAGIGIDPSPGYGHRGGERLKRVRAHRRGGSTGAPAAPRRILACDLLLMSGGWTPAVHLFSQSRGRRTCARLSPPLSRAGPRRATRPAAVGASSTYGGSRRDDAAGRPPPRRARRRAARPACAGDPAGHERGAVPTTFTEVPASRRRFRRLPERRDRGGHRLAAREGYVSVEQPSATRPPAWAPTRARRRTERRRCSRRGARHADPPGRVTTFRPPYTPVTFGALAGRDAATSTPGPPHADAA